MGKSKQQSPPEAEHETILVELPKGDAPETKFEVAIQGMITPRQYRALRRIGAGLNGRMGVYAKANDEKLKNIQIVRCILESIADRFDAEDSAALSESA